MKVHWSELKPHPEANIIPPMRQNEWQEFYTDVAMSGVRVPIEVLADGTIIDGHHRWRAAKELNIEVETRPAPLHNDDPITYMLKTAVLRRHLSDDQRSICFAKWNEKNKQKAGRPSNNSERRRSEFYNPTRTNGKELWNITERQAQEGTKLYNTKPEVAEKVWAGDMTFREAKQEVKKDRERKTPELKAEYNVGIRHGDFREVLTDIPDQSVKLIFTDPPYGKQYLPLWSDLAIFASRVLQLDGALIAYSGQLYLPQVINMLCEHLEWWWQSGVIHKGNGNLTPLGYPVRKVINQFKPILMFVRKDGHLDNVFRDLIDGTGAEKDKHNWAQSLGEAKIILNTFCHAGDLIVDPFAGSGTIGEAANTLQMQFIGAEILDYGFNEG